MTIENAIASLAVRNLASTEGWYTRLFGRAADSKPMPEVAEWRFPRGGWLQVYQLAERAGACSCTLAVQSVDEEIARLDALGVDTHVRTANEKVRTVMITDPDGNHIALAEAIDRSMAR